MGIGEGIRGKGGGLIEMEGKEDRRVGVTRDSGGKKRIEMGAKKGIGSKGDGRR